MTSTTTPRTCCSNTPRDTNLDSIKIGITSDYQITGMTCSTCENTVTEKIETLPGVAAARATATTGNLTVLSITPIDTHTLRTALTETGYELTHQA